MDGSKVEIHSADIGVGPRDGSAGSIARYSPEQFEEAKAIMRERIQAQAAKDAALLAGILADTRPVPASQLVRGRRLPRLVRRSARKVVVESMRRAGRARAGNGQSSKLMRAHEAIARHQTWLNNKEIRNGN